MDIKSIAKNMAQTPDDSLLLNNFCHRVSGALGGTPQSTKFLTIAEQSVLSKFIDAAHIGGTALLGGTYTAERKICILAPDYTTPEDILEDFICALRCVKSKHDNLQHKDYLGALMALGIKRELIGDIFVGEHGADIVVMRSSVPFLLLNFEKAGKKTLSISEISLSELCVGSDDVEVQFDTVASLRLDAFLATIFDISRSSATDEIQRGKVFINSVLCERPDKEIKPDDSVTLRGVGKAILVSQNGVSKKGKLKIEYKKYSR